MTDTTAAVTEAINVQLFRLYVRVEARALVKRAERRPRLLHWLSLDLVLAALWRLWRKSVELGLSYRTMHEAMQAELDALETERKDGRAP